MSINNITGGVPNINIGKIAGKASAYSKVVSQNQQFPLRGKAAPADGIHISEQAVAQKEIADETKKITAELTADRTDYINSLKEQLESGSYAVSSSDIANSFLSRVM